MSNTTIEKKESIYPWINNHTLQFLNSKSGYLLEGETIQDRFKTICNTLEELTGIEGFGAKFDNYLRLKYIALSTPFDST